MPKPPYTDMQRVAFELRLARPDLTDKEIIRLAGYGAGMQHNPKQLWMSQGFQYLSRMHGKSMKEDVPTPDVDDIRIEDWQDEYA